MRIRVATRGSALARWQADSVAGLLTDAAPGIEVEIVVVLTTGPGGTTWCSIHEGCTGTPQDSTWDYCHPPTNSPTRVSVCACVLLPEGDSAKADCPPDRPPWARHPGGPAAVVQRYIVQ